MKGVSISKRVSVPIKEYQAFMAWRSSVVAEGFTTAEEYRHQVGLKEITEGNYSSLSELKHELESSRRRSSPKKSASTTKKYR